MKEALEKTCEVLSQVGCPLLEKSPHMGIAGITALVEKNGLESTLSNACKNCDVKTAGECPGKQDEINKLLS